MSMMTPQDDISDPKPNGNNGNKENEGNGRHITKPPYPLPNKEKQHEVGEGEGKPKDDEVTGGTIIPNGKGEEKPKYYENNADEEE